jgi:hypothetical protein
LAADKPVSCSGRRAIPSRRKRWQEAHLPDDSGRAPDWRKWKHWRELLPWQAVALSLDIDPDKVRRASRSSDILNRKRFDEGEEFDRRLSVAAGNLRGLGQANVVAADVMGDEPIIRLDRFVAMAISRWEWSLPDELVEPAAHPEGGMGKTEATASLTFAVPAGAQKRGAYVPRLEEFLDQFPENTGISNAAIANKFIEKIKALKARGEAVPDLPRPRYIENQVEKLLPKLRRRRALRKSE